MITPHPRLLMAGLALALAGCSSGVKLQRVNPNDPSTAVGVPHPLMYTRYPVTLRWQVSACQAEVAGGGAAAQERLVFDASVELGEPVVAPDPAQLFVIDPRSLSSPFKTSQLSVEYSPSGGPVALNAKIEDRTAQVIAAAGGLVTGVAKFRAVPVPLTPSSTPAAPAAVTCSAAVKAALKAEPDQKKKVQAANALLDAQVAELKRLSELASPDEATRSALVKQQLSTGAAKQTVANEVKSYQRLLDVLRHEQIELWPSDGLSAQGHYALPAAVVQRWAAEGPDIAMAAAWVKQSGTDVHLQLRARDGLALPTPPRVDEGLGIPVRMAAEGRLAACGGLACDANGTPMARRHDRVLQLGLVYYLPCTSRPFSSVECSYAMDEAGRLKKMGSSTTTAAAEAALGALGDAVKQATEARQVRSTAATKQLEADTAYLKAKAAREAAEASAATAPLQAQAALLDAQRTLAEAELALAQARQKATSNP